MNRASGLAFSLVAAFAVSACAGSETAVQELLGSGKSNAPDASQVAVSQNLSMPPDLQLRAPPDGPSNDNQAGVAPPVPAVEPVQPAAAATEAQSAPKPLTGTQTASAEQPKQDVYERYGISKTDADGKPKPQGVLYKELHDAQLAEKRRANPNYGTFWNMGNIFSDD
jgi:hypothetical protein